ncbi:MAG: DUF5682 family protein, partial [Candidatus Thiodiazotropha sp.]
ALDQDRSQLCRVLHGMLETTQAPPVIRGAVLGALFQAGDLSDEDLGERLTPFLAKHQPAELAVGVLQGLVQVARETLWHIPQVLQGLNRLIDSWPESHFLSLLPALRLLFTELSPKELDTVAHRLAALNGLADATALTAPAEALNPRELALLAALDEHVAMAAERDGIGTWYRTGLGHDAG